MDITKFTIGTPVLIKTDDDIYDSYISAITLSDENFVYFKSGSIRTTLLDKLKATSQGIGNKLDVSGGLIKGPLSVTKQIYMNNNKMLSYNNGYFYDADGVAAYPKIHSEYIPSNSDLNNYTTEGFYYNSSNASSATIANVPVERAFSLLVEKSAGVKQTFTSYEPKNPRTWIRNYQSGNWGDWHSVLIENGTLETNVSFNDVLIAGESSVYLISNRQSSLSGFPTDAYGYGILITFNPSGVTSSTNWYQVSQIYIPDLPAERGVYFRTRLTSNWLHLTGSSVAPVQ